MNAEAALDLLTQFGVEHAQHDFDARIDFAGVQRDVQVGQIILGAAYNRGGAFQPGFAEHVALSRIADNHGHVKMAHERNDRLFLVLFDGHHSLPELEQLQNDPITQLAQTAHDDVIRIHASQSDLPFLPARRSIEELDAQIGRAGAEPRQPDHGHDEEENL